jgi:hypothetical protein
MREWFGSVDEGFETSRTFSKDRETLLRLIEDALPLNVEELRINLQAEIMHFRACQFTEINIRKAAF